MRPGRWLSATAILLLAPWCLADEAEPVDFSEGFRQLAGLGLPALPAGTKWSVLPESFTSSGRSDRQLPKGIKGNGWLLPPSEGHPQQAIPLGAVTSSDLEPEGEAPAEAPGLLRRMLGGGGKKSAAVDADLAADVRALRTGLRKLPQGTDDPFDEDSYEGKRQATAFGRFLIFATQIDQSGDTELANELVTALFEISPNREAIVDAAIQSLASQLHENATSAFFKSKDWKAYHHEIQSLVSKFPRGWVNHGAAALLLAPLATRASGAAPPELKLDGIPLDPAAVESVRWMLDGNASETGGSAIPPEIAAQLARLPAEYRATYLRQLMDEDFGGFDDSSGSWLLKKPEELKETSDISAPTIRMGIAALPVLAALVEDPYLTPHPNPGHDENPYFSSYESRTDHLLNAYAAMNRPASRGDLAMDLLRKALPDPDREIRSADAQTLRELALDFWKQHRNDTLEQLALAYLAEGSPEQKLKASLLLAASANPKDQLALETHMLNDPSPASQLAIVRSYIQLRKSAAKPFLDRYVKALREELGAGGNLEDQDGLPWEIREMKSIEPLIKQLESQVSGQSPQARAREIAREDPKTARTSIAAFLESISDAPPRRILLALLAGAVAARDPEVRGLFIYSIFQSDPESRDGSPEEESPSERTIPPGEAKAWTELLADDRKTPTAITRGYSRMGSTLGELAAIALENSVMSMGSDNYQMALTVTGKDLAAISVPRAKARLANEPIPSLPDAKKVTPARLTEIVSTAGTKAPLEIQPYLKTLSDDERAAWIKWYGEPGDLAIPENVRKLNRLIASRQPSYWLITDMPDITDIGIGFEVSKESVDKIIQLLAGEINTRSRSIMYISTASFPPGLQVTTSRLDLPEKKPAQPRDEDEPFAEPPVNSPRQIFGNLLRLFSLETPVIPQDATGVISASVYGGRSRANSVWAIVGGKAVVTRSGDEPDEFMTTLAEIVENDSNFQLQIQVISREDAKAMMESE